MNRPLGVTLILLAGLAGAAPGQEPQAAPPGSVPPVVSAAPWTAPKRSAAAAIDKRQDTLIEWARAIWDYAEPAFQEHESAKLLADALEREGFEVRREVAGMKTAFVAEYGSGKPVVAILAEYDALPGLAQMAVPRLEPDPRKQAGHGCGHNLFGAASTGAAIAVRQVLEEHKLAGTIRLYGCPAEEGGGGKVYLVKAGEFADVDVALHWHPSTYNDAQPHGCLAVIRFRVQFRGKSAHAAGSPHEGRSAMDGVELMNVGINYLREHIVSEARVHYVVTQGGRRPNVVPDFAEGWYYIRAPKMAQAKEIFERVQRIAKGAALMSDTQESIVMVTGTHEILPNQTLAARMLANFKMIGPPRFASAEIEFAAALRSSLGIAEAEDLKTGVKGPVLDQILDRNPKVNNGSTDVGDVSWTVPTTGLQVATAAREVPGHSWGFVACSGSPIGERGALVAAKVLAATAVELFENPSVIAAAKREFDSRRPPNTYQPLLGAEPPPEKLDAQ